MFTKIYLVLSTWKFMIWIVAILGFLEIIWLYHDNCLNTSCKQKFRANSKMICWVSMSSKNEYIYHATLVMSKLKKFDLKFLKVNWSIGCLEPGSFWWNVMSKYMPSKMIFIHLQISKFQLFNFQIMNILKFHFGKKFFLFW